MTAAEVVRLATEKGLTIAVAESLTGGALAARLIDVPGASRTIRLGVVAYATPLKHSLLGVDAGLLDQRGPVDADVAVHMARGVRRLGTIDHKPADIGISTTGVAGPGPADGHAAGEVFIAVVTASREQSWSHKFHGERESVREASVNAAIEALLEILSESTDAAGRTQE